MGNKHTELPWDYYNASQAGDEIAVIHPQGEPDDYRICTVFGEGGSGTSPEANAHLIVTAVNYYHRLREALEDVLDAWRYGETINQTDDYESAQNLLAELNNLENGL